ncbi:MAG TPA: EVE domain-containing protein [Anaeromyxobacteraceae bacterium]|nr:EVE domain-containing protein [Anaeromyxobacteraceae bacterium]
MARWLLKTEPSTYSFDDLVRERVTAWTGVSNPQAQAHLKAMAPGDELVVYHSGVKEAVGLATVVKAAYPDPTVDGGTVCVDVKAGARLAAPVGLDALKGSRPFEGSPLLRQGRLSVVPLTAAQWDALLALGRG